MALLNYYPALRQRTVGGEPARLAPPTLILWAGDCDLPTERRELRAAANYAEAPW